MNTRLSLALLLAAFVSLTALAEPPRKKPDAPAPAKPAPKKELTREELAQLGGFEPAPAEAGPVNLHVDVLMVILPDALAVPLMEALQDPARAAGARQKIVGLVESGKAKVTGWPRLATKPGRRATVENIQEVRYAVEFDPAKVPAAAVKEPAPKPELPNPVPPLQGVAPTNFETRNTGASFELEANLADDNQTLDVNLSAQRVRLLAWDQLNVRENGESKATIPQPRFQTNKVTQSLSLRIGQPVLIGTYRTVDLGDQMELFILNASLAPLEAKAKRK